MDLQKPKKKKPKLKKAPVKSKLKQKQKQSQAIIINLASAPKRVSKPRAKKPPPPPPPPPQRVLAPQFAQVIYPPQIPAPAPAPRLSDNFNQLNRLNDRASHATGNLMTAPISNAMVGHESVVAQYKIKLAEENRKIADLKDVVKTGLERMLRQKVVDAEQRKLYETALQEKSNKLADGVLKELADEAKSRPRPKRKLKLTPREDVKPVSEEKQREDVKPVSEEKQYKTPIKQREASRKSNLITSAVKKTQDKDMDFLIEQAIDAFITERNSKLTERNSKLTQTSTGAEDIPSATRFLDKPLLVENMLSKPIDREVVNPLTGMLVNPQFAVATEKKPSRDPRQDEIDFGMSGVRPATLDEEYELFSEEYEDARDRQELKDFRDERDAYDRRASAQAEFDKANPPLMFGRPDDEVLADAQKLFYA